ILTTRHFRYGGLIRTPNSDRGNVVASEPTKQSVLKTRMMVRPARHRHSDFTDRRFDHLRARRHAPKKSGPEVYYINLLCSSHILGNSRGGARRSRPEYRRNISRRAKWGLSTAASDD